MDINTMKIEEKIKEFTQKKPSNEGIADSDYQIYLAECAKLLEIDQEINALEISDLPEEIINRELKFLDEEVEKICSRRK